MICWFGEVEAVEVVAALIEALEKDVDKGVRQEAAEGLGRIGARAKNAVEVLQTKAKQDPDRRVQREAEEVLASIRRGLAALEQKKQ